MIILTLLFLLFGIGWYGSYIQPNLPYVEQKQANEVEKKSKDFYYSNGYYRYYNMGELISNSFFRDVVNYYPQTYGSGYNWLSVNSSSVGSATFNVSGAYSIYWYNTSDQYELIFNPSSFIISKAVDSTRNNAFIYSFTFANVSNQSITFNFYSYEDMLGCYLSINGSAWTGISVNECMSFCSLREDLSSNNYEIGRFYGFYDNTQMNVAYSNGYSEGYDVGYNVGYNEGVVRGEENAQNPSSSIYQTIYGAGYQKGYADATNVYSNQSAVANTIFNGIFTVGMLPVNVFLGFMDWEVFGINIGGLVSGLISVAIVVIIIRFILGHKV